MKFLFGLMIAITAILGFTACGNNTQGDTETTENSVLTPTWGMSALVDSVAWQAQSVDTREEQGTIYITGTGADGSKVELELGEKPGIGIFSIRRGTLQAATYTNSTGSKYFTPFSGTTGVINITEFAADSLLAGEFNFSASNTLDLHIISEGKFIAPLHKDASKPAM